MTKEQLILDANGKTWEFISSHAPLLVEGVSGNHCKFFCFNAYSWKPKELKIGYRVLLDTYKHSHIVVCCSPLKLCDTVYFDVRELDEGCITEIIDYNDNLVWKK